MFSSQILKQRLLGLDGNSFEDLSLDIFQFQYQHNKVYRQYVDLLKIDPGSVLHIRQIPFLPIEFFKSHVVSCHTSLSEKVYESSGTTGALTSKHYVYDEAFYCKVAKRIFEAQYGGLEQYTILALLPNYLERQNSSLVAMVHHFMQYTQKGSGFYLDNFEQLYQEIELLKQSNAKIILWGVTFGLLDFSEAYSVDLQDHIVLETGGMKGRKKELVRGEVHDLLCKGFNVTKIHAEYGMTELFSQAYAQGEGLYRAPFSMKILLRELNDPFAYVDMGKRGGVNVIDLANIDSCSFIATQDLGLQHSEDVFEILGRFDASDIRGCNLMAG